MSTDIVARGERGPGNAELPMPLKDRLFRMLVDGDRVVGEADLITKFAQNEVTQTLMEAIEQLADGGHHLLHRAGAYKFESRLWHAQGDRSKLCLSVESEYGPGTGYGHNNRLDIPMHPDYSFDLDSQWLSAHSVRFDAGSTVREYVRGHYTSDPSILWELTQAAAGELLNEIDSQAK
ncbi:MAG TPA: hypothetical protein VIH90_05650 [Candidatus Saccharimonadales bacterium]